MDNLKGFARWTQLMWLTLILILIKSSDAQYKPKWPSSIVAREIFLLNLEDGYFGCQVNESADVLQLFELSKLCDGKPHCFKGSDELKLELKCGDRDHCHPKMPKCVNGACLDDLCYCNDGFGGKGCDLPDENECKYRPCDVFAHCTNTMGSFYCSCFPGYDGDGFSCHDVNECEVPSLVSLCAENAECCNLPGHFVCKCKEGYTGNATSSCLDINECLAADTCGRGAVCTNLPGSYSCHCPPGFTGNPKDECWDMDECKESPCGKNALCTNLPGDYLCSCPTGYQGSPTPDIECVDVDECVERDKKLCGTNATCVNTLGGYFCQCPVGYTGNPRVSCVDIDECPHSCGTNSLCTNTPGSYLCTCKPGFSGDPHLSSGCSDINECLLPSSCGQNASCYNTIGSYECLCEQGYTGNPQLVCSDIDECKLSPCGPGAVCTNLPGSYRCECPTKYLPRGSPEIGCERAAVDVSCLSDLDCTQYAVCSAGVCRCKSGYQAKDIYCIDADECKTRYICGHHAKCYNTQGGYQCECKPGYQKIEQTPKSKCRDINECLTGDPCGANANCINLQGSYKCICAEGYIGDPKQGCRSPCFGVSCGPHATCQANGYEAACICDHGFTFDPKNVAAGCIDINECDSSHGPSGLCGQGALCTNVPGSHHCHCPPGFTGDPFRYCEDTDECSRRYGPYGQCGEEAICQNLMGSFTCSCPKGYTGNPRERCADINECSEEFGPNGKCGFSAICTNMPGSFSCRCPPGSVGDPFARCVVEHNCSTDNGCAGNAICKNGKCLCPSPYFGEDCKHPCDQLFCGEQAKCELDRNGLPQCVCAQGYVGRSNSLPGCVDIDECVNRPCGKEAICRNTPGSYECACPLGFKGDPLGECLSEGKDQVTCSELHPCPNNEECVHNGKANQCVCRRGYSRDSSSGRCRDINECNELRTSCGLNAFCTNMDGGFLCHCPAGYTGNAYSVCYPDVMRCKKDNDCPGNTICFDDEYRGKTCGCQPPYAREGDYCILLSRNCSSSQPCPKNQECISTEQGHGFCICPKGFTLEGNGHCRDINECTEMEDFELCGRNANCLNLPGGYECLCASGFSGNAREGCTRILNTCEFDGQCPANEKCRSGVCECVSPFIKDGISCKHPCEWLQCGQNAECVFGKTGAACQCKPGCAGDPNTGCSDVNECTSLLPIDPNGPCGASAICVNLLGSFRCECPHGSTGDPYTKGCIGVTKCISNEHCPNDTVCQRESGTCIDACSASLCGPNADCIAQSHRALCVCKPGFRGNPDDLIKGCVSPCSEISCALNAQCIINSDNLGVCRCSDNYYGNPWPGGECLLEQQCSLTRPCAGHQECINGLCLDKCQDNKCGYGAKCDPITNQCVCLQHFVGNPEELCVPPLHTPPTCSPTCGTNAHCTYSNLNKCVCDSGYSGNPYTACVLAPRCENVKCGQRALCLESASSLECVCPAGYYGNPYLSCEDINECLQSNPCGIGANCINVIGSYQCICPLGTVGNPLYACQPPRLVEDDLFRECSDHSMCSRDTICYRGTCARPNSCDNNNFCTTDNACTRVNDEVGYQCVDPCDNIQCGPNAFCQTSNHRPSCHCNDSYSGNPHDIVFGCTPIKQPQADSIHCKDHRECPSTTVCQIIDPKTSICVDVCETIECGANAICRANGQRPECICEDHFEGNPYDSKKGCYPPACYHDSDCQEDEICKLFPQNFRECHSVCSSFECGTNALCRGKSHQAFCECRPNFRGDPYDNRFGCQPLIQTCNDDSECTDFQLCQLQETGLRNCTDVCSHVRCGSHAHCVGKDHKSSCRCLPGFVGDSSIGCQKPSHHLCQKNSDCSVDKNCLQTTEGIKDCVDVCFNHRCQDGSFCVGRDHTPSCECLPGFTRLSGAPYGTCVANLCKSDSECRDDEVCAVNRKGILDCISACRGIRCGPNSQCSSKNHEAFCQCKEGFDGNPDDLLRGCPPKDKCRTDNECLSNEVCRLNQNGIKTCINVCLDNLCGPNAICKVSNHFAICTCPESFTGKPENKAIGCQPIVNECLNDDSCPSNAVCVQQPDGFKVCHDACDKYLCGENARCITIGHKPQCTCRQGFIGDPFHRCSIPNECQVDENCAEDKVCRADINGVNKCVLSCLYAKCARDATCIGVNHKIACVCPQGYTGDPFENLVGCHPLQANVCEHNSECSQTSACRRTQNGIMDCKDACEDVVCGPNAVCEPFNHVGKCVCLPKYYGDPNNILNGCREEEKDECELDRDCPKHTDVCKPLNNGVKKCFHACKFAVCGPNSECLSSNHTYFCDCKEGFLRDQNSFCVRREDECRDDSQCPTFQACRPNAIGILKCVEICVDFTCTSNSKCVAYNHRGQCQCEPGFTGDPQSRQGCSPIPLHECDSDNNCPDPNHVCLPNHQGLRKCSDPCRTTSCGHNAICNVFNRKAQCKCPSGLYVGNPYDNLKGCQRVECLTDADCLESKACSSQNFCYDPCINSCGINSVCVTQNHRAVCKCIAGYSGDPNTAGCSAINICESNPCHQSANCLESVSTYSCNCPPDYIGDPYNKTGIGCRHPQSCPNGNIDCKPDSACLYDTSGHLMCKNPCDRVQCGANAVCVIQNHEAICNCPENFRAAPETVEGCVRVSRSCSSNPECNELNQACIEGQCRFVCTKDSECAAGEKCLDNFCVKACFIHDSCPPQEACVSKGYCHLGCRDNSDCSYDEACVQNRCQNPCQIKGICGPNSFCSVSYHNLTCTCPDDFEGNPTPFMGCKRKVLDCTSDRDCGLKYRCDGRKCRASCDLCVEGETCVDGICMLSCFSDGNCPVGDICNNGICKPGCKSDGDCSLNQLCTDNQCSCIPGHESTAVGCVDINECLSKPCHLTAKCQNIPGSFKCICPEGWGGDGFTGCIRLSECSRGDTDCPSNSVCRRDENGYMKCVNPCENDPCGPNSQCSVINHKVTCSCPQNVGYFTGDPYNKAEGCRKVDCLHDSDCATHRQCINFVCESPCDNVDCGPHGTCIIHDRQAACRCNKGFENNGRLSCVDTDECKLHPCHTTAICENVAGSFECKCPKGLVGNAYVHPGCHESDVCYNGDSDCPVSATCILVGGVPKCRDKCQDPIMCGMNATCTTIHHRPSCQCPADFVGDPYTRCERVECLSNNECTKDTDVCFNNQCIHVCKAPVACGENSICAAHYHSYTCKCKEGYYGDPVAGCRRRILCESDENCPSGEFCYKDKFCRIVCKSSRDCNVNERCEAGRCSAVCRDNNECPEEYRCSNGKCLLASQDRCESDNECDDHLACRSTAKGYTECTNVCENILCGRNAVCKVRGHSPVCECLENFIGNPLDERFGCVAIQCQTHENCSFDKVCDNYKCVDPCLYGNVCGQNSQCVVHEHTAVCRCKDGFEGDSLIGCSPINYCSRTVCHRSAICKNKIGGYECICPEERSIGSPYGEPGCRGPNECPNGNSDCLPTSVCESDQNGVMMCRNPCEKPNICGINAICEVDNRQALCRCPEGFSGNPRDQYRGCVRLPSVCSLDIECPTGVICENGHCRAICQQNRDCANREHCFEGRCVLSCVKEEDCLKGEICLGRKCQTGCRTDNDCSYREACILNSCKDLCDSPTACGTNALCQMIAHQRVCSCPASFTGNSQISCTRIIRMCLTPSDCSLNHHCIEGRCRAACEVDKECALGEKCFNDICVTLCRSDSDCHHNEICNSNRCQVGCRTNSQCADHLACTRNQCIDPCEGSATCGPNALCQVVNHRIACMCPENFIGRPNPNVGCIREIYTCKTSNDCPVGESVCTNNRCRATCANEKDCAVNEKCLGGFCFAHCSRDRDCSSDEICHQRFCQSGCRADSDCPPSESCMNNQCIDPCESKTSCGTNAICSIVHHEKSCHCREGTDGNARIECIREARMCSREEDCSYGEKCESSMCRVECVSDNECFDNEKCTSGFCNVICKTDDLCPKGFVCDLNQCNPGCRSDSECPATDACINRKCINVCASTSACGSDAICKAVNHSPWCSCPPKYTGNPRVECKQIECVVDTDCSSNTICQNYKCISGCRSDSGCSPDESCISLQCTNPCRFTGVCGENAHCSVINHQPTCTCIKPLVGNPFTRCISPSSQDSGKGCRRDVDCSSDRQCVNNRCVLRFECSSDQDCAVGSICVKDQCFAGCKVDNDCPLDQGCYSQQCQNPCHFRGSCGPNAQCTPYLHKPKCLCPSGFTGNPLLACSEIPLCQRNDECPVGFICQDSRCSIVSGCVSDHECQQGYICLNNQFNQLAQGKCHEGCRSHSDCDFTSGCIESRCQNPCHFKSCGSNADCHPINHEGVCRCPEGYKGDPYSSCSIEQEECYNDDNCGESKICVSNRCIIGCRSDINCNSNKACIQRSCKDPCSVDSSCGLNALCRAVNHKAECVCPPSFSGDPKLQCTEVLEYEFECQSDDQCGYNQICIKNYCVKSDYHCQSDTACNPGEICEQGTCILGCRRDSDCTYDKACFNSKCINPCSIQTACGQNAECRPVVHRPRCNCLAKHAGNPYDYCKPIKEGPPPECSDDSDCGLSKICEQNKCYDGCRYDSNCPHDKSCINRRCLNPCDFPDSCGESATCSPVNHRPLCSCSSGFTGDASIKCLPIILPICLHDADCGTGQICEIGQYKSVMQCIDACRTDDTCPYTEACINRRCQNPCSVFGACGRNAECRSENHRAICSCPANYKGEASSFCERADLLAPSNCFIDHECEFGFICEEGVCIEGCRNDDHCTPMKTCLGRVCKDPCSLPNACGANANCVANSHRPVCTCKSGFVGDANTNCRSLQDVKECDSDIKCGHRLICDNSHCVIGCRDNEGCALQEACINRLCQNPCSFFGVCGRNADCKPFNHTAVCACPPGYRGNPNVVCTEAPPQCLKDSECSLAEICENTQCISGCRHDNNCPEDRACINGACENPCLLPHACGLNANCQPFLHRPRCECIPNYRGNPFVHCDSIPDDYCDIDSSCSLRMICENNKCVEGCRNDANCKFDESCINKVCQNPCTIYGVCGINALCKPVNHDRVCTCKNDYTGDPKILCERIQPPPECQDDSHCPLEHICQNDHCTRGCRASANCPSDRACIRGKCSDPCLVSGACGKRAICTPASHVAVCSCPSGFRGDVELECREISPECRYDDECGLERICLKQKCMIGCRTHSNCPFDKACVNGFCQSPCNIGGMCGVNTICRSENHQGQCSCVPGYTGDPLRQCTKIYVECELDSDCGSGYVCAQQTCKDINECLQETLPCGPGASCQNLPGWYKCSCPLPLIGNAYSAEGCRLSVPVCFNDADCKENQKCNLVTQECYDVCSKPGICGKGAVCKPVNSKAECECLPGYRGNPYVECSIKDSCSTPADCPGNLLCLGHYCGCPYPYKQYSSFCTLATSNCSTTNSCPENQNCVYEDKRKSYGHCVCPKGFMITPDGTCRDYNECHEKSFPCGPGAKCINKVGTYDCRCPTGTQGDPYDSGCTPEQPKTECFHDSDCAEDKNCIEFACRDSCLMGNYCGQNALCYVENHKQRCKCQTGFVGNALQICRPILDCVSDSSCPGNLKCLNDNHCGCPHDFDRVLDYCIRRNINCSTSNPCADNQECVFTAMESGICICPKGYVLKSNNICEDIKECEKRNICGPNAICIDTVGSYECKCPPGFDGEDPYRDGCRLLSKEPAGCISDTECPLNKKCDYSSSTCYDPCIVRGLLEFKCGKNAICQTSNHQPSCACPPGFDGNPFKFCSIVHKCGVTYQCPGNLICLNSQTCGCPANFFRENDYCVIRNQNCTTTNPCPINEECVYTGEKAGFCVCPHGFELADSGECKEIRICEEHNPCAVGAICKDRPGSYTCVCPVDTIGDPYVKGCKEVVGCQFDLDCPLDRQCDPGSKQCVSPCHTCGPNAECTVRDHQAICICPPGKVGKPDDKEIGCFVVPPTRDTPPTVRTIPPVQDLAVMCLAEGIQVGIRLGGFNGIVYVKGHSQDANCRRLVTSSENEYTEFQVLFGQCGLLHLKGEASFILVVQKHPKLVTYRARAYHIKCMYVTGERTVTLGFNVSMITTSGTIANTGPPPTCLMSICTLNGKEVNSAEIGDDLVLKVDVKPDFIYGGFARSCVAKTMEDEGEFQYEVTDANGCATDPSIFGNWEYDPHKKTLMARFNAFKFPSSNNLRFQCNIRVCFGSCPPVNCDGIDAYGRKKREIDDDDLVLTDAFKEGALREEIMVQSNAILTFEKRDPQPSPSLEGQRLEDIDHVCLPKLGLIISMILTTLLALVAVAVAISCWLMAYRRKPRRHGPLPHPPDFPNPLYTTSEPMVEPSPDYYHGCRF